VKYSEWEKRLRAPVATDAQVASLHARVMRAVREAPAPRRGLFWLRFAVPAFAAAAVVLVAALLSPGGKSSLSDGADGIAMAFDLVAEYPAVVEATEVRGEAPSDISAEAALCALSEEEMERVATMLLERGGRSL
jgi:hypothetical protein